jgi:PAS domain S-box-containing protein
VNTQLNEETPTFGLATRLALFLGLFSLVPLMVTNCVGYTTSRDILQQMSSQSLGNATRFAAARTGEFVDQKRSLVSSLVASNAGLAHQLDSMYMTGPHPYLGGDRVDDLLRETRQPAGDALEFYILDTDGMLLASSDRHLPRGERRDDGVCRQLDGSPPADRVVERDGQLEYVVRAPLGRDSESSPHIFCARFRFGVHDDLRTLASTHLDGTRFRIVDRDGTLIASSSQNAAGDTPLPPALAEQLDPERPWQGIYEPTTGDAHLGAVTPVAEAPWFVVADVPTSSVLSSLWQLRRWAYLLGAGLAIIVLSGIGYIIWTFVAPVADLVGATRQMKQGDLAQNVDPRGPREVAALVEHFNSMSQTVADLRDNLEKRVRDRTDRLQQSHRFVELLFNSMRANLVVVDRNGRVTKTNASARETYGDELDGRPYWEVFQDRDEEPDDSPVARCLETGEPADAERVHRIGDEAEILDVEALPLPEGASGVGDADAAVLVVTRRITEEKHRQAQLIHSEKMAAYGQLAAGLAHEIGNPLSSIQAQLQRARHADGDEKVDETLEVVGSEVRRMQGLLRNMVDLARRTNTAPKRISVNRVVENAAQLLRHNPDSRPATFDLELTDDLPAVRAGDDRLTQVVLNLGINARDALGGDEGTVHIETGVDADEVFVRVSDSGPGVPEHLRDRIFEPHFTTKPKGEGTGLGLFVTERIVEELDGEITYRESDLGGACFEVRLPEAD